MDEIDVLGGLERLIDPSVAELVEVDGPRYTMLEPIRQFVNDRLGESGRAPDAGPMAAVQASPRHQAGSYR
jgi:hypothetical protein